MSFINTINNNFEPSKINNTNKEDQEKKIAPPLPGQNIAKPITDKILSHVDEDFYIAKAIEQEGNKFSNSIEYMIHFLMALPEQLKTTQVVEFTKIIEQCLEFEKKVDDKKLSASELAEQLQDPIKNLQVNKKIYFCGGWNAQAPGTGHAIMHAIEKQLDGNYTLYTYNTGDGIQFHDYVVDSIGSHRFLTPIKQVNITQENICSLNLLTTLIDLRTNPLTHDDCDFGGHIIYDSILPGFGGEVQIINSVRPMRAQRSGTCSWKVLTALLSEALDPVLYKRVKMELRVNVLENYIQQRSKLDQDQYFRISQDLEKCARELQKNGLKLTEEELEKYIHRIKTIQEQSKTLFDPVKENYTGQVLPISNPLLYSYPVNDVPSALFEAETVHQIPKQRIPISLSTDCPDKKKISEHLKEWVSLAEKLYANGKYADVIYNVNKVIKNLPLPIPHIEKQFQKDPFWGNYGDRDRDELIEMILSLSRLTELQFQCCFRLKRAHGDEKASALICLSIQVKLLENLLDYRRRFEADGVCGLHQQRYYEVYSGHMELETKTNGFAHDPILESKVKYCKDINGGWSIDSFLSLITGRYVNNEHLFFRDVYNKEEFNKILDHINEKARARNLFYDVNGRDNSPIDKGLVGKLVDYDFGQFGIAPDFIAALNKQVFITSYHFGGNKFTPRGKPKSNDNPFTIQTNTYDSIISHVKQDRNNVRQLDVWVDGAELNNRNTVCKLKESVIDKNFENQDLKKLMTTYLDLTRGSKNPNIALTNYSEYTSLSPENAKELLTLIHTPKKLICWQIMHYFGGNIDKLKDPQYQRFFEWLFYPRLKNELKSNPDFALELIKFIQNNLEEFQPEADIDGYLFLVRVGMHLKQVCDIEGVKNIPHPDWLKVLSAKEKKSTNEREKKALQAQIAYLLSSTSAEPSLENVKKVIKGLVLLQTGQVPTGLKELAVLRSVLEWVYRNEETIKQFDFDATNVLCSLVSSIALPKDSLKNQKWHCLQFPLYESDDKEIRVSLLTGITYCKSATCVATPRILLEDEKFVKLFGTNIDTVSVDGFNRYYFKVGELAFRVESGDYGITAIEQNIDGKWYRFTPHYVLQDLPRPFLDDLTHWILPKDPKNENKTQLVIQNHDFKKCFIGKQTTTQSQRFNKETGKHYLVEKQVFEIHRADNQDLVLINHGTYYWDDFSLSLFENPDYICSWKNSLGEIEEINFPRYTLTFAYEVVNGKQRYISKQIPGYYIAEDQKLDHFSGIKKFLVLTNALGRKKVLIPNLSFKRTLSQDQPLLGKTKSRRDRPFSYQIIELDKEGKAKNLKQEQALYLAYIALVQKDYIAAGMYLNTAEHKYGENLATYARKIFDLVLNEDAPDNHPKALAISLRVGILNLKNDLYKASSSNANDSELIHSSLKILYNIYRKYHQADLNAADLRLDFKEERFLLQQFYNHKMLGTEAFDRFVFLHKEKSLEREQKKALGTQGVKGRKPQHSAEWSNSISELANWIDDLGPHYEAWQGVDELKSIPLTNSKKNFIPYFLKVCLQLDKYTTDPEKKAELEMHLRYVKWTKSMTCIRLCLEEIVQNPSDHKERLNKLKELLGEYDFKRAFYLWIKELGEFVQMKQQSADAEEPALPRLNPFELSLSPPRIVSQVMPKSEIKKSEGEIEWLHYFESSIQNKESSPLPPLEDNLPELQPYEKHHLHLFNEERKKFYENKDVTTFYKLTNPEGLKSQLETQISKDKTAIKLKQNQLLAKANGTYEGSNAPLSTKLEVMGGTNKNVTFDQLIVLYLQGSQEDVLAKCHGLNNSPELAQNLMNEISNYLVMATTHQQNKRVLKKVESVLTLQAQKTTGVNEDLEIEIENTMHEAYEIARAQRCYSISSHPEWLVFEWASDILLRTDQTRVLDLLQSEKGDPASTEVVIQLIMGAGKSKVLLPLLALKRADGEKLSMIVVPSSLYETNRRDLKTCSLERLHQEPITFEFDRSTPFTEEALQSKLWDLQNAIINKKYVVTTPESLMCLKLKYQEVLKQINEGTLSVEAAESKMRLLSSLLDLIKRRGWAILDEADTILNIRREVNFPIGKYQSVPKEQLKLVKQLYEFLLKPEIEQQLYIKTNRSEAFNKSTFISSIAPQLADHLIEQWSLENIKKEDLKLYLIGALKEEKLNGLAEHTQRKQIALAKELITTFLPSVLMKKGNEGFGLSHETNCLYPIPYKGNNTPDESSEFGNIYETLLYAVHIYAQDGLKEAHIDALLQETCHKIRMESKERSCIYKETPSFRKFATTYEVENPFDISKEQRLAISNIIKNKQEALFDWLMHFVYPEIKTTNQKINANSLTLIDMLGHVQGFTGTPWNRLTYHDRLNKPERELELSSPESELKILHAIYQKVKDGGIHTLSENTATSLLNKLISDFKFDCLIDVGALLNGITNQKVAEDLKKIAASQKLKAIVYFNDDNEIVADLMDGNKPIGLTKISIENFLSYYDQIHTTGTDITQRPTAKALMTFGNKTVRDMTQGAMRMRRLLTSQNIEIVIPSELSTKISPEGKKTTFDQLLSYAVLQQAHRLADDIVRKTRMQMKHIINSNLDSFIEKQNIKTQAELHGLFEEVLTDFGSDDTYQEFGEGLAWENTLKELENNRTQQMAIVQRLFSSQALDSLSSEIKMELVKVKAKIDNELSVMKMPSKEVLKNQIPKERKGDLKQDTKVEIEKEMEVEVEQEVKKNNFEPLYYKIWADFKKEIPCNDPQFYSTEKTTQEKLAPKVLRVNALLSQDKSLQPFKDIFDPDLCTTSLFSESVTPQPQVLFGRESQKKAYHFLFVVEPDKSTKAIIVDPAEAAKFKQVLLTANDLAGRKLILQNLDNSLKLTKGDPLTPEEQDKFDRLAVQVKFFNGDLDYTKKEWKLMMQWLNSVDAKKAKELFEVIVNSHLGLAKKYEKSTLANIWKGSAKITY